MVWYGLIWFEISDINWNKVFGGGQWGDLYSVFTYLIRIIHDLPKLQEPDFFKENPADRFL